MNLKQIICAITLIIATAQFSFSLDIKRDAKLDEVMFELKSIKTGSSENIQTGRELTHLLDYAYKNYNLLSSDDKKILSLYKIDENEFDVTYITPDDNFKIYFKSEGIDAVEWIDNDGNGYVDLIEMYGRAFMYALEKYQEFGFKKPYSNDYKYYKVYVASSSCGENVLGYNALVDYTSSGASGSYTVLRSDYSNFAWGKPVGYGDSLLAKITIAHEYFHGVQRSYSNSNMNMFIMEGGAVWSEQFVYPGELDPLNYVQNFLLRSNIGINYNPQTEYNPSGTSKAGSYYLYPYGSWSYYKYLTDLYGNEIIKELYNLLITEDEIKAFNKTLEKYNTNYAETVKNFYTTCITFNNDINKKPYYFSMGEYFNNGGYSSPRILPTIAKNLGDLDEITVSNLNDISDKNKSILNRLATHYIRFNDKLSGKYKLMPHKATDDLSLIVCQYKTKPNDKSGTDFKIYEIKAAGEPAELDVPHSPGYDNTIIMIFNNSTKNVPSETGWNESVNSAYYNLTYTANKSSVEDYNINSNNSFSISKIFPTPANDKITLQFNTITPEDLFINIYDNVGRLIKSNKFLSSIGGNSLNIGLDDLNAGNYIIELKNNIKSEKISFIKQ